MHTGRASSPAKERSRNRARNWNREHSLCIHHKCWQPSKLALCNRTFTRWCTRPIPVTAIHVTKEAQQIAFANCLCSIPILRAARISALSCSKTISYLLAISLTARQVACVISRVVVGSASSIACKSCMSDISPGPSSSRRVFSASIRPEATSLAFLSQAFTKSTLVSSMLSTHTVGVKLAWIA